MSEEGSSRDEYEEEISDPLVKIKRLEEENRRLEDENNGLKDKTKIMDDAIKNLKDENKVMDDALKDLKEENRIFRKELEMRGIQIDEPLVRIRIV